MLQGQADLFNLLSNRHIPMVQFNLTFDLNVTLEQRLGFEMAAQIWSQFLTDDTSLNLHISATDSLNNGQAVGGAVPIFHEVHYGVYQAYLALDATSAEDASVLDALQDGNTVDVWMDGELVDGNSTIMLTRAQAKALGMDEALLLEDGSTWTHDMLQYPTALDGYVVINNSYDWNYDLTREDETPEGELDFLTMALHELGHSLGFVSGLDGLIETFELHSGETRTEGFTALDLYRYSDTSVTIDNPDGSVSDLSFGGAAYFSLDGGSTALAEFEEGGEYQASHWQRFQNALGIMDPTLGYQERTNISQLDLQAFDVLGWDIDYGALEAGLDLNALYDQAMQAVSQDFGVGVAATEDAVANGHDWYTLARGSWWEAFKDQMIDLGHGGWWQDFEAQLLELHPGGWWQSLDQEMLALGPGGWWQIVETKALELGHGGWWQQFEAQMLDLSPGGWWQQFEPQMIEMSFGGLWQVFEQQMLLLGHGGWWQEFEAQLLELGHGSWWQAFGEQLLELGPGGWWQIFEETVLELGHGGWWQEFEAQMLDLSPGGWWQAFELGPGSWWQQIEQHLDTIETVEEIDPVANPDGAPTVVSGGAADDILGGTLGRDLISGGAGDDLIDGKDGDDILLGDEGKDIIYGWTGQDVLFGGDGDDLLSGENDNDELFGEAGADILSGGRGDDFLDGGEGRDDLKGDTGQDVLMGGAGDDRLSGGSKEDLLVGGAGQDFIEGGDDDDTLYGGDYFVPADPVDPPTDNNPTEWWSTTDLTEGAESATDPLNLWVRLEAEDMWLFNYNRDGQTDASGGEVIASRGNKGKAKTTFNGPSGTYDLAVGFYDDANGVADMTLEINSQGSTTEYTWQLDGSAGAGVHQISGVTLNSGDKITLQGDADGDDLARLDYLDILTAGAAPTFDETGTPTGNFYTLVAGSNGEGDVTRLEAETMTLSGGYVQLTDAYASGDGVVAANGDTTGVASFTYTGEAGIYNLYANYFDSSLGGAQAEVFVNGESLYSWNFNLNDNATHELLLGEGVTLTAGDVIAIHGQAGFVASVGDESQIQGVDSKVEAENMILSGNYVFENQGVASGGSLIKTNSSYTATTAFNGPAGFYNIVAGYYDENDGASPMTVKLDGAVLDSWTLNQQLGNAVVGTNNFVQRTIASTVALDAGAVLEVQGSKQSGEYARFDFVEFIAVDGKVEVEDMTLSGDYVLESQGFASGGSLVKTNSSFTATTKFTGSTGLYNIVIGYYDENDGASPMTVKLDGTVLDNWIFDQQLGNAAAGADNLVTRTVANAVTLNSGALLALQASKEAGEYARIDYVDFIKVDTSASSGDLGDQAIIDYLVLEHASYTPDAESIETQSGSGGGNGSGNPDETANAGTTIQLEIEDMDLSVGSDIDPLASASGGHYVQVANNHWQFQATSLFSGESGYYDVVVGYYDENDGVAELIVNINNQERDRWFADQNLGSNIPDANSFTTRTVANSLYINQTDLIELTANRDDSDWGALDYIQFVSVAAPPTPEPSVDPPDNASSGEDDVLRGGAGNDTAYGGAGNDLVYGDSGNDTLHGDYGNGGAIAAVEQLDNATYNGSRYYNGSLYLLSDSLTWANAQAQAESYDANLVTINDAAENQWLLDNFDPQNNSLWTGLTDQTQEGQFEWASGQAVTYTNWAPGQPHDSGGDQDYAILNWNDQGWDDNQGTFNWQGIIEKELSVNLEQQGIYYEDSVYLLTDSSMSWTSAQAYAESVGGNLVTINNAAENQWLKDTFGTTEALWTGFSDAETEGVWKWASGEGSDWVLGASNDGVYADWAPNEPDDYNGNQDYAVLSHIWLPNTDKWDDATSTDQNRGIIEIKLTPGPLAVEVLEAGNDNLVGGSGNDSLNGDEGDDILTGTDNIAVGLGEIDSLTGGGGADLFILGDANQAYYGTQGNLDYAIIKDFNASLDTIQLYGSSSNYQTSLQGDAVFLYMTQGGGQDLTAIFEDTTSLALSGNHITYL